MKKLLFFWDKLTSTFWFVPVLIILTAIGLAPGFVYLDSRVAWEGGGLARYLLTSSAGSARSILTTIAGAMIGVAGTVFSITLVALTLASSQFGPRLIRNFMYDRLNQVVLGSYIALFIYSLLVLNTIKENGDFVFIPSFSILLALIGAVANIILLIVFIHHIAIGIQADKVISDISTAMSAHIRTLFPEIRGDEKDEELDRDLPAMLAAFPEKRPFLAGRSGYLQYADYGSLVSLATSNDLLIELHVRPGDYLVKDSGMGLIHSLEALEQAVADKAAGSFIVGDTRTHQQDAEHSIHQLVEIAARALSPGVNDPYTAIACIDNLTSALAYLSTVKFPSRFHADPDGHIRLVADALTFEGMLNAAFNQIRQYAKGSPSVVIRLMEALIRLDKMAVRPEQKRAIKKHAAMVMRMAENTFDEPNDVADLKERSKHVLERGQP
jgi:uncharacterized membrane protein